MATDKLTHNGFTGSYEFNLEDDCIVGRVLFIDDIVTYEGRNSAEILSSFKSAVDRYLAHCKSTGKPANKPYSGSFNVRVGPELHRKAVVEANACGLTLNQLVVSALETRVKGEVVSQVEHSHRHTITVESGIETKLWAQQATDQVLGRIRANTYQHS